MKILKTVTIIALLGATTIAMLNAKESCNFQYRGEHIQHIKNNHHNMRTIFKELNLSNEQRDKIRANRKEMRKLVKSKRETLKLQQIIHPSVSIEGVNREQMIENAQNRAKIRATIKADFIEKTLTVLNDEQKEKFVELLNNRV